MDSWLGGVLKGKPHNYMYVGGVREGASLSYVSLVRMFNFKGASLRLGN